MPSCDGCAFSPLSLLTQQSTRTRISIAITSSFTSFASCFLSVQLHMRQTAETLANAIIYVRLCRPVQDAPIKSSTLEKFYIVTVVANFKNKFIFFTEEDSGHICSEFCYNI